MNVLIIPEDFRKDQYVLKPVIKAMFMELGKPNANVQVCQDPLLQGVSAALDWNQIQKVLLRYPTVHLFLLCIDRDGKAGRADQMRHIETNAAAIEQRSLLAEAAWQEIEVWTLAAVKNLPKNWDWKLIREEADPKEVYFIPYVTQHFLAVGPDGGRKHLGKEAGRSYKRLRQLCPEIADLEGRAANWLKP